jgi:hypothetical protein
MTELQKKASRTNGALSQGPKTEEGKRRSSQNAVKHGLSSATLIVLKGENKSAHDDMIETYQAQLGCPDDVGIVGDLIDDLASARWRLYRTWTIERAKLDQAIAAQPEELEAALRYANAYWQLANDRQYTVLHRYETDLDRKYHRALGKLLQLKDRGDVGLMMLAAPGEEEMEAGDKAA